MILKKVHPTNFLKLVHNSSSCMRYADAWMPQILRIYSHGSQYIPVLEATAQSICSYKVFKGWHGNRRATITSRESCGENRAAVFTSVSKCVSSFLSKCQRRSKFFRHSKIILLKINLVAKFFFLQLVVSVQKKSGENCVSASRFASCLACHTFASWNVKQQYWESKLFSFQYNMLRHIIGGKLKL